MDRMRASILRPARTARPVLLATLLCVASSLLAGCGGSSPTSVNVPTTGKQTKKTSTVTHTVTTDTSTATTTTTTANGSSCTASDLTPAFVSSNGAAGHVVLTFALRNTSSAACHTYGFPGVEFLATKAGASPKPITTHATRTVHDFAGETPLRSINLGSGQQASFRVIVSDVANTQLPCETARGMQIIAPDDTVPMTVALAQPASVCGGEATVSPLEPGLSAGGPGA